MFDLLQGVRIVDLTTIVLGPYATQMLADLGADVIKVEAPEGDLFRSVRPGRRDDLGVQFQNFNRNKRSIVVDLKTPEGRDVLADLVAGCDVLVHNMRGRSAAGLGASYEALSAINPALVYCFAPGFGQSGPDRDAPAYDDIIQARSGLAALNADDSGTPRFVRTIACDKVVGLHLAVAVASGLVRRERTGRGCCIEAPMLEAMTSFVMAEHLAGHSLVPAEGELGYARMMSPHRRPYRTRDGFLAIMPYSTRHWVRFFELSDRPALAEDARVLDPALRSEKIDELYGEVAAAAAARTTDDWIAELTRADVPFGRVNSLAELEHDPQLADVGLFEPVRDAELGELKQLRSPFEVDGSRYDVSPNALAPRLGEHTDEILSSAGYSAERIAELLAAGVVRRGPGDGDVTEGNADG